MGILDALGMKKKVAVFVDGQNVLSEAKSINLMKVKQDIQKYGEIVTAKVFLANHTPLHVGDKARGLGFQVIRAVGGDVDSVLTLHGTLDGILEDSIDMFVLISGDSDYNDMLHMAKKYGKRVMVVGFDERMSKANLNVANWSILE